MATVFPVERNALSHRKQIEVPRRLRVAPADDCARFTLRVADADRADSSATFGCPLPARIGGLEQRDGRLALCVGPDEWLLLAPIAEAGTIEDRFRQVAEPHSLVDVGHREVGIDVSGPSASIVLNSGLALDLSIMSPASGTRTIFDKAPIVLIKHSDDQYRIEVWQSFATHVWDLLSAASREIALGI
jgi:sarcosine oxidase subunit gamma